MNELTDAYCDVDHAAEILRVHPESVRRLIRTGRLKADKLGNKWMINRVYLQQYARDYDPRPGNVPTRIDANVPGHCPGCGMPDTKLRPLVVRDGKGRHWHLYCVEKALANVEAAHAN